MGNIAPCSRCGSTSWVVTWPQVDVIDTEKNTKDSAQGKEPSGVQSTVNCASCHSVPQSKKKEAILDFWTNY